MSARFVRCQLRKRSLSDLTSRTVEYGPDCAAERARRGHAVIPMPVLFDDIPEDAT